MFGLDTRVLRIVYTLGVCYLVYALRGVIFLLLLSIVAAYVLLPAVELASRLLPLRHQARAEALTIVFVIILAILLTTGGVIGYYAFQQASALAAQVPSMIAPDALQHIHFPKFLQPWDSQIRTVLQNWRESHAKDILETLTSMTMKLFTAVGSVLSLLIILVLSYLLLRNAESYKEGFLSLLPDRYEPAARSFLHDMNRMLRQWSRVIVLVALGTVVLYGIGFSVLRVPYSILLAMIAFPFEFVPLIGPPVGFGIILMVAFASGYHHLLWLIVLFVIVRLIEDSVLQPYFMRGGSIELAPIVVIFGALAGEAVAGVPGLLLSVPAIATIRLLYRYASKGYSTRHASLTR
jgi:predicted PurR-regulated permease PerM